MTSKPALTIEHAPTIKPAQTLSFTAKSSWRIAGVTPEPWSALAAAQMFVLSSDYEGFPNVMLEALALGVACVSFDCPSGPRDLASAGTSAVLVPPGEVSALAQALQTLAADRKRRLALGTSGAEFVRQRFSEASVVARWDRLFETLLAARAH